MNYELFKKLKDAGISLRECGPNDHWQGGPFFKVDDMVYFSPRLEELLLSLNLTGNEDFVLTKPSDYNGEPCLWSAYLKRGTEIISEDASEPDEAVGLLLLTLHAR